MTESTEGRALAVQEKKPPLVAGAGVAPIIPRTIEEVARVADAVIVAGLAPDSYKTGDRKETASRIMIGIMKGAEIGLAPLTALANIAIINGRPCLYGDGGVALIQGSGLVVGWTEFYEGEDGTDEYTAVCRIFRKGQTDAYEGRFSVADAKRARLLSKGPWIQFLSRMLMWRARTYAMRTGFADCLSGLSIAEEINDLPAPPKELTDTSFLDDATTAAEVTGGETASQPAQDLPGKSEALQRGEGLLAKLTDPDDIKDLHETIAAELESATEKSAWDDMVKGKMNV